jgi:hypothetical protein
LLGTVKGVNNMLTNCSLLKIKAIDSQTTLKFQF